MSSIQEDFSAQKRFGKIAGSILAIVTILVIAIGALVVQHAIRQSKKHALYHTSYLEVRPAAGLHVFI